jgi:7-carboxy-7-deazaguanine synthase
MILVNEIYGPVPQGEGKSAGKPVMFLRLSGCNLACIWCDTPYTWNWIGTKFEHPDKYDQKVEAHRMLVEDVKKELTKEGHATNLCISGGEPLLQQKQLIPLLKQLRQDNWWIEVETNGTIKPMPEFNDLINQYNCSPKLANAGNDNPQSKRWKFDALVPINVSGKASFKFVIQSDEDLSEMQLMMKIADIRPKSIWLMPEGKTKEEQEMRQEQVEALAKKYGYNFSPRLHILAFGNKRAV